MKNVLRNSMQVLGNPFFGSIFVLLTATSATTLSGSIAKVDNDKLDFVTKGIARIT